MTASKNSSNILRSEGNKNSNFYSEDNKPFENYEFPDNNFEMIPENHDFGGDTGMMH